MGFFLHLAAQSAAVPLGAPEACFIFFMCYGGFRTAEYSMNAMNTAYSSLSTGYEIAGVFARVLRIPGTLACPGCSR
jgi:hypothetical protein